MTGEYSGGDRGDLGDQGDPGDQGDRGDRGDRNKRGETSDATIVVTGDETVASESDFTVSIEEAHHRRDDRFGAGAGFDLKRPIAPVPGALPWDLQPAGERGLSQGLPVSYGARMRVEAPLQTGIDEVQRRIGSAPEATPVCVATGRSELPSLQRKDRCEKRVTLGIYAGVGVACLLGLWGVAAITFGW